MATLYTRTIGSVSSHYTPTPGTSYDSTITFKLICTYTQNTTNNTSTTSIYIQATNSNTNVPFKVTSWAITGNGGTKSGSESSYGTSSRNFGTASATITHGTGGGCTFSSGCNLTVSYYSGTGVSTSTKTLSLSNASYALPTINVYSTLAFSSTTPDMNTSITLTITKANVATSGTRIKASYDSTTTTIYEGTGTSTTWTVPNLVTTTTDATVKTITISIQSVKGSTYYSAKTYTIDAQVPSTYVPSISIGTVTDNLSAITPFVIDYSKLTIPLTGSVSSDGGATITRYALEVRETNASGTLLFSASTATSDASKSYTMTSPITTATTYIKATITDSRGRTATATTTKSASAYTKPSVSITAIRCDSGGTASQFGTYAKITITWSIANLTGNSVVGNAITYKSTGGSYSSADSRALTGTSGSYSVILSGITISTAAWFYTTITDQLEPASSPVASVQKAIMPFSLYDDGSNVGATVGQIASESGFNVYLPMQHRNRYVIPSQYPSTSAGFVVVATITINKTYFRGDMLFRVMRFNGTTPWEIGITFAGGSTTDPSLQRLTATDKFQSVYLYKKATSTWELLVEATSNQPLSVLDYQCGYDSMNNGVLVEFTSTRYASLPGTLGTDLFQAVQWTDLYLVTRQFSAVDLNTFTEAGTYYVYNGTTALHFPSGVNGSLIVIKNTTNVVRQIFFRQGTIDGNDYNIWTRQCQISTNTWGKWTRIQQVYEEGTSGDWYYRKYADGKAECWCSITSSVAITKQASGGFYRNDSVINAMTFPSGLFTVAPAVYCTVTNSNGTIIWCTPSQTVTTTNFGGNHDWHIGSGTYNCTNSYYAIGRWY